ncbi:MAG: hypothetical protein ACI845_004079 [Gammaproteobacteria bacterium]|jgi:SAM-dependent methyltransferase
MNKVKQAQSEGITMSGGGLYSLATIGAKDVIDAATPLVTGAIAALGPDKLSASFTMSDMGCADAGTSLTMVSAAIDQVHTINPECAFNVVYTDQPRNDFNALIMNIYGLGPFETYLDGRGNIFPVVSGTSFYRQIVSEGSLDIGFSATAMHWLSQKPCDISDHVQAVGASGSELEQFKNQAKSDWQQILLHRARELKPGGKLILINFGRDEQGRYLGNTGGINMFDTFNNNWLKFVKEGRISDDEYKRMTLPQYYNSVEEFSAPLTDKDNPVYQAGLRLDSIETRVVECPFARSHEDHGDAQKFAKEYIPTIRSWNESIFFNGLSTDRPEQERREVIEDYYQTYQDLVAENPEGHGMDYVHAYTVISKVS